MGFCLLFVVFFWLGNRYYGRLTQAALGASPKSKLANIVVDSIDSIYRWPDILTRGIQISPIDGMTLVFIPGGEFEMGSSDILKASPVREAYLDAFWIDKTEVSNQMYGLCVQDGICTAPHTSHNSHFGEREFILHPVIYVTWYDANTYCAWAGRRLPTEAEFEKAARGTDKRVYPWGEGGPDPNKLNYNNLIGSTTPVGRYPKGASPYGVLNLAGNVREWVADWYSQDYYAFAPKFNPSGPPIGEARSLRGGGFNDTKRMVRAFNRFSHNPLSPGFNRGFRCAKSP